jgi:hypothetical protein
MLFIPGLRHLTGKKYTSPPQRIIVTFATGQVKRYQEMNKEIFDNIAYAG